MSAELTSLTWVVALTAVLWVPYILNTIMVRGLVDAVGYRLRRQLRFATIFADSIEDNDCVVERVTDQSQKGRDDGQVDLEITNQQHLTECVGCDVGACDNGAECDADVVEERYDGCEAVADVAGTGAGS